MQRRTFHKVAATAAFTIACFATGLSPAAADSIAGS